MTQWLETISSWFYSEIFTRIGFLLALVLMAGLLRQRRSPSSTIAWLLAILLLPNVGVPLYIIFGGRKVRRLARLQAADLPDLGSAPPAANPTGPSNGCWRRTEFRLRRRETASSSCRRESTPTSASSS